MGRKQLLRIGIGLLFVVGVVVGIWLYFTFDPETVSFFPPCLFHATTGLKCPGCGSQRAIHALLQGDFVRSFCYNPLLLIAIPYLLIGFTLEYSSLKRRFPKMENLFFGKPVMLFWLILISLYLIFRNLYDF